MGLIVVGFSPRFKYDSEKCDAVTNKANFKVAEIITNISDLLNSVIEHNPNVVVVDIDPLQINSYLVGVLNAIYVNFTKNIIIVSDNSYSNFKNYYRVSTHYWKLGVIRVISRIRKDNLCAQKHNFESQISTQIAKSLHDNCFSSSHLGYHYLAKAIEICYNKNGFIKNFTTEIYFKVADNFKTDYRNVERNIRHAIKCAIEQNQVYPNEKAYLVSKLATCSNRRVISSFANELLIKMRSGMY